MSTVVKDLGAATAYGYAVEKGYTGTEAEFAELMADYAEVGQRAEDAADSALESKTAAQTAATTATNKASEATTAAQTASTKASEAVGCVETATQKATEATQSASQASGYAQTAETAKTDAQTAKTQAETARDNAVMAKTAAETAQGKAEDAQEAAEDAAESVSASAAQIATNTADITDLKEDLSHKANADGSYDTLTAGNAKQLLSNLEQTDMVPYNYRTAGGSLEIGDREKLKKIVGGTVCWNQLVSDNVIHGTIVSGISGIDLQSAQLKANHKYLYNLNLSRQSTGGQKNVDFQIALRFFGGATAIYHFDQSLRPHVVKVDSTQFSSLTAYTYSDTFGDDVTYALNVFDLTAMFGTKIADYIYQLEQTTAGAGVAFFKSLFPKNYYEYNSGELVSVSGLSEHKMVGFNLLNPALSNRKVGRAYAYAELPIGKTDVLQMEFIDKDTSVDISGYSIGFTSTDYDINSSTALQSDDYRWCYANNSLRPKRKNYGGGIAEYGNKLLNRFLVYPNTEEAWTKIFQRFDISVHLVWDGERDGEYEPYEEHSYPLDSDVTLRGIPKLDANNNLYYDGDEYAADGTVTRKYGIVDLGTLNWNAGSSSKFYTTVAISPAYVAPVDSTLAKANIFCSKYVYGGGAGTGTSGKDKVICYDWNNTGRFIIFDSDYSDMQTFQSAMNGVYLVYELATPTTEQATPYRQLQICDPNGTEEFVTTGIVPVGHETRYPENLRAKIDGLPWDFSSLIAPTEKTTTASRNYTAGNLLIMGNVLYKVTANIANGGTITPNTNVTATTLSEILSALAQ